MKKTITTFLLAAALSATPAVAAVEFCSGFDLFCWQSVECVESTHEQAKQGDACAQFTLGLMYSRGNGVTEDNREAVRWFRAAAEQGEVHAQFHLGLMYGGGEGVVEDQYEEYIWYSIAKAGGHGMADFMLMGIDINYNSIRTLTDAEIKSAKREANRRLEEIEENRKK